MRRRAIGERIFPTLQSKITKLIPGATRPIALARKLGYNLTVLPPGKAQCPFHSHRGEEEMFLILEGEGELRFGDQRHFRPVAPL